MVKIILEKEDIEKLIKEKYHNSSIEEGIPDDFKITLKVSELPTNVTKPVNNDAQQPQRQVVRDDVGNIDATKSGLTSEVRNKTRPGGAMGRDRGRLPTF